MRTVLPKNKVCIYGKKEDYRSVGKEIPRVDGIDKVTGEGRFVADIKLPGMLYTKILRSPHPMPILQRLTPVRQGQLKASGQ